MIVVPVDKAGRITISNVSAGATTVRADVVGYYPRTSRLRWGPPRRIDVVPGTELTTVACPTSSFCMAGDAQGNTVRFKGTSWARTLNSAH